MVSPTRLNDVRILHFEPASPGGQFLCTSLVASMHYAWPLTDAKSEQATNLTAAEESTQCVDLSGGTSPILEIDHADRGLMWSCHLVFVAPYERRRYVTYQRTTGDQG